MTDSTYVMMTKERWAKWSAKEDLPNRDLWDKLLSAAKAGHHKIRYMHVDGHTGHVYNERCDSIAREQATKYAHVLVDSVKAEKKKSCRELIRELMLEERRDKWAHTDMKLTMTGK